MSFLPPKIGKVSPKNRHEQKKGLDFFTKMIGQFFPAIPFNRKLLYFRIPKKISLLLDGIPCNERAFFEL